MRSVVFTDLDGCLFGGSSVEPTLEPVATDRAGVPCSYQSPRQARLFEFLMSANHVVPVTGRSLSAFERVALRFTDFAIVHHGAAVLDASRIPCETYHDLVRDELAALHPQLDEVWARTRDWIARVGAPLRLYRQQVREFTVEVCVKSADRDASSLEPWAAEILAWWRTVSRTRVHFNGNNLAIMPARVGKREAVAWVRNRLEEEHGAIMTVGLGDSVSDLDFMRDCDCYIVPQRSQLDEAYSMGAMGIM